MVQSPCGGHVLIPLDTRSAESRYLLEPSHNLTPEKLFERQWALTVLELVLARLQAEFAAYGKQTVFERLKPFLTGSRASTGYAEVAAKLGMTEGAVKVTVHRLRRRYRQLLRQEIAETVAGPDDVDEEIRHLFSCF